jgi:putative solute:sodium symporter small subunit
MDRSPPESRGVPERLRAYWRENSRLIIILLIIWFLAAYAHPPFAKALNNIHILTGFPLGYWLASQGSLAIFVILIFVYALVMNNVIDPKYGFGEEEEE